MRAEPMAMAMFNDKESIPFSGRLRLVTKALCSTCLAIGLFFSAYAQADIHLQDNNRYFPHIAKALYLYHFANFVRWPEPFPPRIRYCSLGSDTAILTLKQVLYRKTPPNRSATVASIADINQAIGNCEILYIPQDKLHKLDTIPPLTGILTVSDGNHFLQRGGMIELRIANARVKPAIALENVRQGQLAISSRLLRVALPPAEQRGGGLE